MYKYEYVCVCHVARPDNMNSRTYVEVWVCVHVSHYEAWQYEQEKISISMCACVALLGLTIWTVEDTYKYKYVCVCRVATPGCDSPAVPLVHWTPPSSSRLSDECPRSCLCDHSAGSSPPPPADSPAPRAAQASSEEWGECVCVAGPRRWDTRVVVLCNAARGRVGTGVVLQWVTTGFVCLLLFYVLAT